MLISTGMLERQIDWLAKRFTVLSLDEIASHLNGGPPYPEKHPAAITFDDGYSDVYEHAFPILRRRGIPAAVFVLTDLVGTSRVPLYDRLYLLLDRAWKEWPSPMQGLARIFADLGLEMVATGGTPDAPPGPLKMMRILLETLPQSPLERLASALQAEVGLEESVQDERRPLTWEMLVEMQRAGITIGSHSRTHPLLTREDREKILEETAGSKRDLEARLGITVRHFAYPNGWFNPETVRAVEAAGYRCAYTSCWHRDPAHPLLTLPRTLLWENSGLGAFGGFSPAVMGCQADGTFDRVALCPLDHWN